MYRFKTLKDFDFKGKTVLLRVDFNLPIDQQGQILNNWRIKKSLKTINYLLDQNVKLIIATHFGRPNGEVIEKLRVDKIAQNLSEIIQRPLKKLNDILGAGVEQAIQDMDFGDIIMLENIQFNKGEINNSDEYAQKLASYADIFVFDCFGQAHRNYASIAGIQKFIPSCAGFLVQEEVENLNRAIENPPQPFYALIGGMKPDKIGVIELLMDKVDKFLIGGVLANTFLKAQGINIGFSKFDQETLEFAKKIIKTHADKIILPEDVVIANAFDSRAKFKIIDIKNIPIEKMILDIGPQTITNYERILTDAQTIIWAGTLGVFEWANFAQGTNAIANFISNLKAVKIIGGGDTASAIENLGLEEKMTHVSTGGGASLEFLSGKELPGLRALEENYKKY